MSSLMDDVLHLSKEIGPRPAGTEEERRASLYIAEKIQKRSGLSFDIEDFEKARGRDRVLGIAGIVSALFLLLGVFLSLFTIISLILTLLIAVIIVLEVFDKPIISNFIKYGYSQNVVSKFFPTYSAENKQQQRKRKIVFVTHYDTGHTVSSNGPSKFVLLKAAKIVSVVAMCITPLWLILKLTVFAEASGGLFLVVLIVSLLLAIVMILPAVLQLIKNKSSFNEGANCNAAGNAALIELARQLGMGIFGGVREEALPDDAERFADSPIVHGFEGVANLGVLPPEAEVEYNVSPNVGTAEGAEAGSPAGATPAADPTRKAAAARLAARRAAAASANSAAGMAGAGQQTDGAVDAHEQKLMDAKAALAAFTAPRKPRKSYDDDGNVITPQAPESSTVQEQSAQVSQESPATEQETEKDFSNVTIDDASAIRSGSATVPSTDNSAKSEVPSWYTQAKSLARNTSEEKTQKPENSQRSRFAHTYDVLEQQKIEEQRRIEEEREAEKKRRRDELIAIEKAKEEQIKKEIGNAKPFFRAEEALEQTIVEDKGVAQPDLPVFKSEPQDQVAQQGQTPQQSVQDTNEAETSNVKQAAKRVGDDVKALAYEVGDSAKGVVQDAGQKVKTSAQDAGDKFKAGAQEVHTNVKASAQETRESAKVVAQDARANVKVSAQEAGDKAKVAAQDAGQKAKVAAQDAGDKLKAGAQNAGENVKNVLHDAEEGLKDLVNKAEDDMKNLSLDERFKRRQQESAPVEAKPIEASQKDVDDLVAELPEFEDVPMPEYKFVDTPAKSQGVNNASAASNAAKVPADVSVPSASVKDPIVVPVQKVATAGTASQVANGVDNDSTVGISDNAYVPTMRPDSSGSLKLDAMKQYAPLDDENFYKNATKPENAAVMDLPEIDLGGSEDMFASQAKPVPGVGPDMAADVAAVTAAGGSVEVKTDVKASQNRVDVKKEVVAEVPSIDDGVVPAKPAFDSNAERIEQGKFGTGSFSAVASKDEGMAGATGTFAPVTSELLQEAGAKKASDMIVEDADDSAFDNDSFTETGAFAGAGYVNIPDKKRKGFFSGFFGSNKKSEGKHSGVEVNQPEKPVKYEKANDDMLDWEGGAFSSLGRKLSLKKNKQEDVDIYEDEQFDEMINNQGAQGYSVPNAPGVPGVYTGGYDGSAVGANDQTQSIFDSVSARAGELSRARQYTQLEGVSDTGAITDENNRISSMVEPVPAFDEQIQEFHDVAINIEVWMVALGAEVDENAGIKSFLMDHAQELRGAIIVDIEGLGAGELSLVDTEGMIFKSKTSSRVKRNVRRAAQKSNMSVPSVSLSWGESSAAYANRHGFKAVRLVGMQDGMPAYYAQNEDVAENVDEGILKQNIKYLLNFIQSV